MSNNVMRFENGTDCVTTPDGSVKVGTTYGNRYSGFEVVGINGPHEVRAKNMIGEVERHDPRELAQLGEL